MAEFVHQLVVERIELLGPVQGEDGHFVGFNAGRNQFVVHSRLGKVKNIQKTARLCAGPLRRSALAAHQSKRIGRGWQLDWQTHNPLFTRHQRHKSPLRTQ